MTMADAETVQWVSVTSVTDELSTITRSEAAAVPVAALVAAAGSSEQTDPDRAPVVTGKTLYLLDPGVVPGASDWFTIRGERYEVVGEAHRWGSYGVEVTVKRAEARP